MILKIQIISLIAVLVLTGCETPTQNYQNEDITGIWCSEELSEECISIYDYNIEYTRFNGSFVGTVKIKSISIEYRFSYYEDILAIEIGKTVVLLKRK